MPLSEGSYRLGSPEGRLWMRTYRAGIGAAIGHDLTIEATSWDGTAHVVPSDPEQSYVRVRVRVDSLTVREGTGGVKPLTQSDRAEIWRTMREKILVTRLHPDVMFSSTGFGGTEEELAVDGSLSVLGISRPLSFQATISAGDPPRVTGKAQVTQSEWGIKPYSAFFGALQLRDAVDVHFDAALLPA
jgi:polyisoprenoid-binding protein YceI